MQDESIIRQERAGSMVKEAISEFIEKEFKGSFIVSVTGVIVERGMKSGFAYITAFPQEKEEQVVKILNKKAKEIQRELRKNMKSKFTPMLKFEIDPGEESRRKIESLFEKLKEEE